MFVNIWQHLSALVNLCIWQDIKIQLNLQVWQFAYLLCAILNSISKGRWKVYKLYFTILKAIGENICSSPSIVLCFPICNDWRREKTIFHCWIFHLADWVLVFATFLSEIHADYIMFLQGLIVCIMKDVKLLINKKKLDFGKNDQLEMKPAP